MANEIIDPETSRKPGPGTNDTTGSSASKAPQTRPHAEHRSPDDVHDVRLMPGGAHGAPMDVGMSSLDRQTVPNRAASPEQTDFGQVDVTWTPE